MRQELSDSILDLSTDVNRKIDENVNELFTIIETGFDAVQREIIDSSNYAASERERIEESIAAIDTSIDEKLSEAVETINASLENIKADVLDNADAIDSLSDYVSEQVSLLQTTDASLDERIDELYDYVSVNFEQIAEKIVALEERDNELAGDISVLGESLIDLSVNTHNRLMTLIGDVRDEVNRLDGVDASLDARISDIESFDVSMNTRVSALSNYVDILSDEFSHDTEVLSNRIEDVKEASDERDAALDASISEIWHMLKDMRAVLGLDNVIGPSTNIIPEIFAAIKAIDIDSEFEWRILDPSTDPSPGPGPDDPGYDEYWRDLENQHNYPDTTNTTDDYDGYDDDLFPDEPGDVDSYDSDSTDSIQPEVAPQSTNNAFNEFWRSL